MTYFIVGFVLGSSFGFILASILMARGENISYGDLKDEVTADQGKLRDLSRNLEDVEM